MKTYARHYLYPSLVFASKTPYEVTTILGSCISICLWDSSTGIGGINHYMLPLWNGEGLASPKYGNIAIEKLLEKLLSLGCNPKHLQAKVFGGSDNLETSGTEGIGRRNYLLARDLLREEKIPVLSASVGGNQGRKIIFYTDTGEVLMKYLGNASQQKNQGTHC